MPGAPSGAPRIGGWLPALAVLAGWLAAYLWVAAQRSGGVGLPLDDAWIHARVARNLVAGHGLVFNPGERAAVTTAPLWTLCLAVPMALGIPWPWGAYLAGAAAAGVLAWLTFRIVLGACGDRVAAAAAAALVVSTHPLPWAQASGMEPTLAAALVLATILAAVTPRRGAALLGAGAASLVRPELVLLSPLLLIDALRRRRPAGPRVAIGFCLGALAAAAAPFLLNLALSGTPLPAAFAAKVGRHGIVAALLEGRADRVVPVILSNVPAYAGLVLKALAGDNLVLLLLAPLGFLRLASGPAGTHLPWLLAVTQPIAMAVLAPFGGPDFQEQRYMTQLVVLVTVAGVTGLAATAAWRRRTARAIALAVVAGVSCAGAWRGMTRYAIEVGNIAGLQVRAGSWLAARPGGPGLVATNDIGAIGFLTGAPILDTTGLATPEIIPYLRRPPVEGARNRGWNGANETGLLEYLHRRRPRYVAVFPAWYPSPSFQAALGEVVMRFDIEDNLICGDRTLLIYRPDWGEAPRITLPRSPGRRAGAGCARDDGASGEPWIRSAGSAPG